MRTKKEYALISILVLSVLLVGSFTLVVTPFALSSNVSNNASKATFNLISMFDSKTLPGPQPSPYCWIEGGTVLIMCYTPQDLKTAYNYPNNLNGAGETIVIVDAFGSPTVQSDLDTFDTAFGLPATTLQIVCQDNAPSCPNPLATSDELGWTQEIALDTQYAHAMAPLAHIVLFVGKSDDDLVLEQAVQQAVNMFPHSIISQSWGDPELDMLQGTCTQGEVPPVPCNSAYVQQVLNTGESAYERAASEGTTVFASAGDLGADLGYTSANPSWPASSPWVTAVGGTMGNPYYFNSIPSCTGWTCSTGLVSFLNTPSCQLNTETPTSSASCLPVGYGGEQVWNEPSFNGASGGAPSLIFQLPFYQQGLGLKSRATPDVSYDAAVDGGVFGYWSAGVSSGIPGGFYIFGGTSAGSPQWSAIAALADQYAATNHQGTIGFINPALYEIGNNPFFYKNDFHDITVGNNILTGSPTGFNAHSGWDDASGWGTPNVGNLIPDLVRLSLNSFSPSSTTQ